MNEQCLRDQNILADAAIIRQLREALSNATFSQRLGESLWEFEDPLTRQRLDHNVAALNRQRDNEIKQVEPVPGYVLKTSANGCRKVYVNICSDKNLGRPEYYPATDDEVDGHDIFIPHVLLPVQNVSDEQAAAYTVAFHPETLEKCSDDQIKRFVNETALAFVEKSFDLSLDKVNVRVSKKPFKGTAQLTTVRWEDHRVAGPIHQRQERPECGNPSKPQDSKEYTTPVHRIKYRNEVDLQDNTQDRYCKLNALLPKEMIVEIELPLLKSILNTQLDVQANSISLRNEQPNYKLRLDLPYKVNPLDGAAKFDPDLRLLRLDLKVCQKRATSSTSDEQHPKSTTSLVNGTSDQAHLSNGVSGSDEKFSYSGGSSRPSTSGDESSDAGSASEKLAESQFLDANVKYKLPLFDCNRLQQKLAFTIHVKNVNLGSFDYQIFDKRDGFWVKFCSLGGGHFPMFFTLCVVFAEGAEAVLSLEYSVEEEKVFVYAKLRRDLSPLEYWAGIDRCSLEKRYLNEPEAVVLEAKDKELEGLEVDLGVSKFSADQVDINVSLRPDCRMSVPLLLKSAGLGATANRFSTATAPTPMVFDNFEKFDQLKKAQPLEKLDFEAEVVPVTNFGTFCDDFEKRFSLDEDVHCLSESELLPSRPGSRIASKGAARAASLSNGSWIVESKSSKKAKRQKKARDKKLASNGSARQSNSKGAAGGVESEPELNDSNTADDSFDGAADVQSAYKFSDLTSRSILKKHRSFSESSGDELIPVECSRSYSIEDVDFSSDSLSQSVPKKTVRFNEVILKKLYSSEISILEQRKRSKRRVQRKERKASDSDNSETETSASTASKLESIRLYNENLFGENSDLELTSLSESGGETSDDQSDNADGDAAKSSDIPCSKKNHKRRGKKSARKNASTAKHQYHID